MLGAKPGRSVVSNRRDKIHQTWGTPLAKLYSKLALYELREREGTGRRTDGSRKRILHRQWQSQLLVRTTVDVRLGPQHACRLQYGVGRGAP